MGETTEMPLKLPVRPFVNGKIRALIDGDGREVIHWMGFDASALSLDEQEWLVHYIAAAINAYATPTSLPADAGRGERHPDAKVIEDGVELLLKHYTAKSKQPTLDAIHVVTSIMQATRRATPSEPRGQEAGKVLGWKWRLRGLRHNWYWTDNKELIEDLPDIYEVEPIGGIPQGGGER